MDIGETTKFDVYKVRKDFPALHQEVNGHPLVYLDNGATTQKPESVIDAISHYYRFDNSNVHRGAHTLSDRATIAFERAREIVAEFIHSSTSKNVIWTRGTTEAINLVANSWGKVNLKEGDKIFVSHLEHHSNIVPWQLIAKQTGASVVPIPISDTGDIEIEQLAAMLDSSVKMIAVNHVSNALGTVNPVEKIIKLAASVDAKVLVDGAQAVSHWKVDVEKLGCDFYVFSGHKMFGPTGIGVLWGKETLLDEMPPYHGGGEMIEVCSFSGTTFNQIPFKFEAGTPDIAGAVGLAAAVEYLNNLDRAEVAAHETSLLNYIEHRASDMGQIRHIGCGAKRTGVFSFLLDGAHPADLGTLLDQQGIAVRTGHHCAQPLMERLAIPGTVRASIALYNTKEDIDRLFEGIEKAKQFLI